MNPSILLPLDHIGIAVQDLDLSIAEYKQQFGFEPEHRQIAPSGEVELVFLKLENTRLELLAPTPGQTGGRLQKFLDSHGPGLHHLCYRVDDIRAELKRLKGMGLKLIDEVPRPGAHGSIIAFLHPSSTGGVLTELCEY